MRAPAAALKASASALAAAQGEMQTMAAFGKRSLAKLTAALG